MSSAPSRSNADPVDDALSSAVAAVRGRIVAVGAPNPVVVVDGRSGAGKSSLVRRLVADWPGRGRVQSVALDDVYPGWDGLDAGVAYAREMILSPHARGIHGVWERWDWERSERVEAYAVDPSLPLVVEGAGLLTPEVSRLADVSVWVEAPATSRRTRALARDGDTYRPHWERWARQEEAHIAAHSPAERADVVVRIP